MAWDDGLFDDGIGFDPNAAAAERPSTLREFNADDYARAMSLNPEAFRPQQPSIMDRIMLAIGKAQEAHGYLFQNPAFVQMGKGTQDETLKKIEAHQAVREFSALTAARKAHIEEEDAIRKDAILRDIASRAFSEATQIAPHLVPNMDAGPPVAAAGRGRDPFKDAYAAQVAALSGQPEVAAQSMSPWKFDPEAIKAQEEARHAATEFSLRYREATDPDINRAKRDNAAAIVTAQVNAARAAKDAEAAQKPGESPVAWIQRAIRAEAGSIPTVIDTSSGMPVKDPEAYASLHAEKVKEAIDRMPSAKWSDSQIGEVLTLVKTPELYTSFYEGLMARYKDKPLPAGLASQLSKKYQELFNAKPKGVGVR